MPNPKHFAEPLAAAIKAAAPQLRALDKEYRCFDAWVKVLQPELKTERRWWNFETLQDHLEHKRIQFRGRSIPVADLWLAARHTHPYWWREFWRRLRFRAYPEKAPSEISLREQRFEKWSSYLQADEKLEVPGYWYYRDRHDLSMVELAILVAQRPKRFELCVEVLLARRVIDRLTFDLMVEAVKKGGAK